MLSEPRMLVNSQQKDRINAKENCIQQYRVLGHDMMSQYWLSALTGVTASSVASLLHGWAIKMTNTSTTFFVSAAHSNALAQSACPSNEFNYHNTAMTQTSCSLSASLLLLIHFKTQTLKWNIKTAVLYHQPEKVAQTEFNDAVHYCITFKCYVIQTTNWHFADLALDNNFFATNHMLLVIKVTSTVDQTNCNRP